MKILLAPAEIKKAGGEGKFNIDFNNHIVAHYERFISNQSIEQLSSWFGLKNLQDCKKYSVSLKDKPTMKAINRYIGVAFEALDYNNLSIEEQEYCDNNIIIFSNLFGAVKASDKIPDYKFKQGVQLPEINNEKYYKENLKTKLDDELGEEIVDLRAGYYDKFYKPSASVITFKFLKNGKVVSHWAKHYRGLVVQQMAKNNITSFADLMNMPIDGLQLQEIQEKKNIKTLIMTIQE